MSTPPPARNITDHSSAARRPTAFHWQSKAVLLLVAPAAAVYAAIQTMDPASLHLVETAAACSLLFAAPVLLARAGTLAATLLGALLAFCYGLIPAWPHSALWLLAAMLLMTLSASRIGRARKHALASAAGAGAESHGRTAAQVAANLGVGALAGALINSDGMVLAHAALLAALAEAAADTLASELGQLAKAPPRMLLTGRVAAAGTDGAVSVQGTLAGILGIALLCLLARWSFALPWWAVAVGGGGAAFGLFFDSVLGQLLERRGWLNNDAVNFLSTGAAACFAVLVGRLHR